MTIELTWIIPGKILLSRWYGEITPADMQVLLDELAVAFENADGLVHTMIDLSNFSHTTPEAVAIYANSEITRHPRRGRIAMVMTTISPLIKRLSGMANQQAGLEMIRLFTSRSEAQHFLLTHDTPPPPLDPSGDSPRAR